MAWHRIVCHVLVAVSLAAAVARRKPIQTPRGSGGHHGLNDTQLLMMYHSGKWEDADYVEGDAVTEVGHATVGSYDDVPGYMMEDDEEEEEATMGDDMELMEAVDDAPLDADHQKPPVLPRSWTPVVQPFSSTLSLDCSDNAFTVSLPAGPITEVRIVGAETVLVNASPACGYEVSPYDNTVMIPFTGCHVKFQDNQYTLELSYISRQGRSVKATLSCVNGTTVDPRAATGQTTKCPNSPTGKAQNCNVHIGEQMSCGAPGITTADCELAGCCVNRITSACFYPVDECTVDQHFVFAIRPDSASVTIDPTKLIIPGKPSCVPVMVNSVVALFKFPLTDCGSRSYTVGDTMIYMVEVHTIVQALNLKFGVISRSDAVRFMIECRYPKSGSGVQPLTSVGFQVKIPVLSFPSTVTAQGLYGVELRLAKDRTYSSYYTADNLPLKVLLGTPVYLELNLLSPKPGSAELVVNYCLAFPRSAKNALVLVYEGCSNPNDPTVSVLSVRGDPTNKRQRRFMVQAFQFMDVQTNTYLDEQIYFMCSTNVCMEKPCAQGCFTGASP